MRHEEAIALGENPHVRRESMQTQHREQQAGIQTIGLSY